MFDVIQLKNQTLLKFIFCIVLLFSLNTALKSACTGDIDLNGANIINVGKITPYIPVVEIPVVEINNVKYASTLQIDEVFTNTSDMLECTSSNGNSHQLTSYAQRDSCPFGSSLVTEAQRPSPQTIKNSIGLVAYWTSCKNDAIYVWVQEESALVGALSNTVSYFSIGSIPIAAAYRGLSLCRLDNQ